MNDNKMLKIAITILSYTMLFLNHDSFKDGTHEMTSIPKHVFSFVYKIK